MKALTTTSLIFAAAVSLAVSAQEPQPTTPETPKVAELKAAADGRLSDEQIRDLLRIVAEKDLENDKKRRDYTYIQYKEEHKLDGDGKVKSTETETREVLMIFDEQIERLLAKNDKPLSDKEAAKEEERIQKIIDKRKNESEDKRKKRLEKKDKEREEGRKFVLEVADAYNFQLVGTERLQERDAYVIDATPREGYKPKMKDGKFLPKFRFRAWIDKDDFQLAKLDALCIDTVSFGLFLARLHKGSRVVIEQTRVNEEVWLPRHLEVQVDARVALLKKYNLNADFTFRDYRKFRSESRIVGVQEVKQ